MAGIEEFLLLSEVFETNLISLYFYHEYVCLIIIKLLPFRNDFFYIYMFFVCVCMYAQMYHSEQGEVTGPLSGICYLLLCEFQGLNTGHKAW